jgi:hypothetical protein
MSDVGSVADPENREGRYMETMAEDNRPLAPVIPLVVRRIDERDEVAAYIDQGARVSWHESGYFSCERAWSERA